MRAIIFDAIRVTSGGSAKTIMKNITDCGMVVDEKAFLEEWKSYYKNHTLGDCEFMTERDIFIARIQMFYDRYNVNRNAENDAEITGSVVSLNKPHNRLTESGVELRLREMGKS